MNQYFRKRQEREEQFKKYYNTPANRRLKYLAFGVISIAVILLLITAFWIDTLSFKAMLIMRILAGVCAVAFAILYVCLYYRVNRAYWQDRSTPKNRH